MLNGEKRKIDVEREEAAEIIAVNTFKEIKGMKDAFGKLATAISQKTDKATAEAVEKVAKSVEGFVKAVKEMPKPEKPEVNVELNSKEFAKSVDTMCEDIIKELGELRKDVAKKREWVHKVTKRDYSGYIEQVTSTQIK